MASIRQDANGPSGYLPGIARSILCYWPSSSSSGESVASSSKRIWFSTYQLALQAAYQVFSGGPPGARTRHLGIKSPLLFPMS